MDEFSHATLEDWCDWNEGKIDRKVWENADLTFLFSGRSDEEIEKIFSYFPQRAELIERYFRARKDKKPVSKSETISIVKKDIENMIEVSVLAGNEPLAEFLRDIPPIQFESDIPNDESQPEQRLYDFMETINEYVIFNEIEQSPSASDIHAGLYYAHGNNFRVTYALSAPLIKHGHLFEHYLDLYSRKIDYQIFETGVLIFD